MATALVLNSTPTYSNNSVQPLTLDTSGNLKVAVSGTPALPSGAATESTLQEIKDGNTPDSNYVSKNISVSGTETEAMFGVAPLTNRKMLLIQNQGPDTIYYGPSGVDVTTGISLAMGQLQAMSVGPNIHIFLITAPLGNSFVVVQEIS